MIKLLIRLSKFSNALRDAILAEREYHGIKTPEDLFLKRFPENEGGRVWVEHNLVVSADEIDLPDDHPFIKRMSGRRLECGFHLEDELGFDDDSATFLIGIILSQPCLVSRLLMWLFKKLETQSRQKTAETLNLLN